MLGLYLVPLVLAIVIYLTLIPRRLSTRIEIRAQIRVSYEVSDDDQSRGKAAMGNRSNVGSASALDRVCIFVYN